jgi:protein-tyrosine phosphatase
MALGDMETSHQHESRHFLEDGMIDLHSHILFGLDDGPETLAESLEMCRIGYEDGIRTMVATPHTLNSVYRTERSTVLSKVAELNAALREFGIDTPHSISSSSHSSSSTSELPVRRSLGVGGRPLTSIPSSPNSELPACPAGRRTPNFIILPGSDVHLCEETLSQFDQGKLATIGDGKKFILIEFPSQGIPYMSEQVLLQFLRRGVVPIISHPERNMEIGRRPGRYYEMIRMGCLGQVTAMSLTGHFGQGVKRLSEKLMTHNLIHFIASDAHSANGRPPILSHAVEAAAKMIEGEEAGKMVTDYPRAILEGKRPYFPLAIPF